MPPRGIRRKEEPGSKAICKYTLYKYVKVDCAWRYLFAVVAAHCFTDAVLCQKDDPGVCDNKPLPRRGFCPFALVFIVLYSPTNAAAFQKQPTPPV